MHRCPGLLATALILVASLGTPVRAERATPLEMENVARNWVTEMTHRTGSWAGSGSAGLAGEHEVTQDGLVVARYYDVSPRGYVVVPVLKELTPVMLYSDESNLDASQEDGMLQLVRDVLAARYDVYRAAFGDLDAVQPAAGEVIFDTSHRAAWDRLAVAAKDFRIEQVQNTLAEGGPLLTSSWHQSAPYNDYCPMGDGGRCVVGCTATSLSQILDYWQWPASGLGSHSYDWGGDDCNGGYVAGYTISADFSDAYDWANIPDSCDGVGGCTPEQEAALAALCHEAGVSVEMNYGACGSGANMDMGVFPNHFKYKASVSREYRVEHTQQSWFDVIRSEIDSGRVMWYHINSHAIVCDGYRDNGGQLEYHMNYGWGQGNNAWYVLDNLYCGWISGGICPYLEEDVTIHIEPQTSPDITLFGLAADDTGGDHDGLLEAGEAVTLSLTVRNAGNTAAGAVGLLYTSDPYVTVTTATASFGAAFAWGETRSSATPFSFEIEGDCPNSHLAWLYLQTTDAYENSFVDSFLVFLGNQPGWSDDLDTPSNYWEHGAIRTAYSDQWHRETIRRHSGSTSWKFGGAGAQDYSDESDGGLVTPPFLLPNGAQLRFWHWIEAEDDANQTAWDGGIVMISDGDGAWAQIHPVGGYPYTIIDNDASPFAAGTPCYSGSVNWSEAVFDLSAYDGIVRLMFRFGSDAAVTAEGWYIDDITVVGTSCCQGRVGDANMSGEDEPTIGDISVMIDAKFITGDCTGILTCPAEADVNQSGGADPTCEDISIGDISILIDYLFISGSSAVILPNCP